METDITDSVRSAFLWPFLHCCNSREIYVPLYRLPYFLHLEIYVPLYRLPYFLHLEMYVPLNRLPYFLHLALLTSDLYLHVLYLPVVFPVFSEMLKLSTYDRPWPKYV